MSYMDEFNFWLNDDYFDQATKDELLAIRNNEGEIEERFYKELEFGTGGLIGAACAGVMLQVIAGITSASQADSILMKFSWDGAISWRGIILALVLLVFTRYIKKTKDLHPIVFIGVSAVIGVVFHFAGV